MTDMRWYDDIPVVPAQAGTQRVRPVDTGLLDKAPCHAWSNGFQTFSNPNS